MSPPKDSHQTVHRTQSGVYRTQSGVQNIVRSIEHSQEYSIEHSQEYRTQQYSSRRGAEEGRQKCLSQRTATRHSIEHSQGYRAQSAVQNIVRSIEHSQGYRTQSGVQNIVRSIEHMFGVLYRMHCIYICITQQSVMIHRFVMLLCWYAPGFSQYQALIWTGINQGNYTELIRNQITCKRYSTVHSYNKD